MNSFTSAVLGEIHTPVNILSEFLATFNRRQKCKAAILSWLDGKHYYGHEWVRITFEKLADILGYCRETISRHMKELVFDDLIKEQAAQKFPKDTACEYQLNREKLTQLLNSQRCEKIDTDVPDISTRCANNPPTFETTLELNPIERVWKYLKQDLKWELFDNLEDLRAQVAQLLAQLTPAIAAWCDWL